MEKLIDKLLFRICYFFSWIENNIQSQASMELNMLITGWIYDYYVWKEKI